MSSSEILSEDEINALLNGIDSGKVATKSNSSLIDSACSSVSGFDFAQQQKIIKEDSPLYQIIAENLQKEFKKEFYHLFHQNAELTGESVKIQQYGKFISELQGEQACFQIQFEKLGYAGFLFISRDMLNQSLEQYFGGSIENESLRDPSDFTPTESRMLDILCDAILKSASTAWSACGETTISPHGLIKNIPLANIFLENDYVFESEFILEVDNSKSSLTFLIPHKMVNEVNQADAESRKKSNAVTSAQWESYFRREIQQAKIAVKSDIANVTLTIKEVLRLKAGDIIPIELLDSITLCAEGIPTFRATMGTSNAKSAVKILDKISHQE